VVEKGGGGNWEGEKGEELKKRGNGTNGSREGLRKNDGIRMGELDGQVGEERGGKGRQVEDGRKVHERICSGLVSNTPKKP